MSSNKVKGIMCIISSAFCFALMNMFVRMAGDLPSIQKSFFRNFIALIIAFIVLIRTDEKFKFNKKNLPELLLRSIFGTMGILCNFYAIDHLVLSDASMLNKLSPFFAVICSYFVLKGKAVPGFSRNSGIYWCVVYNKATVNIGKLAKLCGNARRIRSGRCIHYGQKIKSERRKRSVYSILFLGIFVCCDIAVFDS